MKEMMKLALASVLVGSMLTFTACSSTEEQADLAAEPVMQDGVVQDDTMPTDPMTDSTATSEAAPAQDVNLGASSTGLGH